MIESKLVNVTAGFVGDVLSAFSVPGGNTLAALTNAYCEKRTREATQMFIEEVRNGYHGPIEFTNADVDPMVEVIYRFKKALEDGAAMENLRLLAQAIAGLKKNKALNGDAFRRWAGILEHATRDELVMIGFAYRMETARRQQGEAAINRFWENVQESMRKAGYAGPEISSLGASVSGYGLLIPVSALSGMLYCASPWLIQLGSLANMEGVQQSSKNRDGS